MDQKEMTERQREIVTASITQMVVDAAMPDRDGKRMPGEDLKKLAEDAADAISAGMAKVGQQSPGGGSVLVYGPQGCGKTRHSEALAAHFGVGKVVDDWRPGDPVEPGALHLSQVEVPGAVAYESLKAVLNLCDTCRGAREIRRPYSAVERIPCPICSSAQS